MKRFLNLFYTDSFKALLLLIMLLSSFLTSSCIFEIAELYKEDSAAVANVVVQRKNFDFETSEILENDIQTAIENVVSYALDYHRNDAYTQNKTPYDFSYGIDMVVYLAENLVKDNVVYQEFINLGFIELTPSRTESGSVIIDGKYYRQKVNEDRIRTFAKEQKDIIGEYARRSIDSEYRSLAEKIDSYKDFNFAVVNYSTGLVVSNIKEIDSAKASLDIRSYFGNDNASLLIVHDAKNPYYEKGTMTGYVSFVQDLAGSQSDNFDLYISFPNDFEFTSTAAEGVVRHREMERRMYGSLNKAVAYFAISLMFFAALVAVAGKREYGGKVYLSVFDRIPNDILIFLYIIVLISLFVLLENSAYMIIKTTDYENYWFNRTPGFYIFRAKATITGISATITALVCTLKRQLKNKTLFRNSYIYKFITVYKSVFAGKKRKSDK